VNPSADGDLTAPDDLEAVLACPRFYASAPARVVVRETHISWVFLAGERAHKLNKPVLLAFLDYRTPARRRRCAVRRCA